MTTHPLFGIALAVSAFCLIGAGVGAAGTSLLVLLAKRTDDKRRAAAATMVWVMMIAGFIVTTAVAGHMLDPFSPLRLIAVSGCVSVAAMVLTIAGVWGIEARAASRSRPSAKTTPPRSSFRAAFMEVWAEPKARRFAIFVFVSMLAYSAQDLILEPFAGVVFGFTPGETTRLSGVQHAGTLIGMALVPLIGALYPRSRGNLQIWTVGGCLASAIALLGLAAAALVGPPWPLRETVFMLGVTNGAYAVAAIGSMMALVSAGGEKREGVRMGLWGAAQAFAFGIGGFLGNACERHRALSAVVAGVVICGRIRLRSGIVRRRGLDGGLGPSRAPCKRDAERNWRSAAQRLREDQMTTGSEIIRCGGCRRRPVGRDRGARSCQSRAKRAVARSRRAHQALRRRDPAAADPRFRHSRSSAGRPRQFRAHGVAVGPAGRYADRWRVCRHGRSRCVRRVVARTRGAAGAKRRTGLFKRFERDEDGKTHRALRRARRPTAR